MSPTPWSLALALVALAPPGLHAQADTLPPSAAIGMPVPVDTPSTSLLARRGVVVGTLSTLLPFAAGLAMRGTLEEAGGSAWPGPLLFAAAGLIVGPAIGDFSVGLTRRGLKGLAWRGVIGSGFLVVVGSAYAGEEMTIGPAVVATLSAGFILGHAIWDIATLPKAVRTQAPPTVTLMPVYVPATGTPGLGVHIGF